ncbi:MAG: hypothetical protein R6U98_20185 [Pirellulaceae bacterium]
MIQSGSQLDGKARLEAALDADGTVTLAIDGQTVKEASVPGPLASQPLDGLQVGQDTAGSVGDYSTPFPLEGQVEQIVVNVVIEDQ